MKARKQQKEKKLSLLIATELKKIPMLMWRFDIAADINLTMGQSAQHKKLQADQRGYPDLFLAEARKGFHGLYIELKNSKDDVYRKDGVTLLKKKMLIKRGKLVIGSYDHNIEQQKMHDILRSKGYKVQYGWGFDDTIKKITDYLVEKSDIHEKQGKLDI